MGLPCDTQRLKAKPMSTLIHGPCDTWLWWHTPPESWALASDDSEERTCSSGWHFKCVHLIYQCSRAVGLGQMWMTHAACQGRLLCQLALCTHKETHWKVRCVSCRFQSWLLLLLMCPARNTQAFVTSAIFLLGCSSKNINEITHDKQSGLCKVITQ